MGDEYVIFAGSANPELARRIAGEAGARLGDSRVDRFPDGELSVRLCEPVRGREVFIVQSTQPPVNENLVELLVFADACRRSAAARITAIIPYYGYARSDKRHAQREAITARMVADLLQTVGVDHVVTVDVHAPQVEGFFRIPVDNLTAVPVFSQYLAEHLADDVVVVSPDAGRVKMATEYAHRLGTEVAVMHKRRRSGSETHVTHLVGDVAGRSCLVIDDMISTGGTIVESVEALLAAGARNEITIAATHGLLINEAIERMSFDEFREIVVSDTVSAPAVQSGKLRTVSIAPVIAGAIRNFIADGSLSSLY